MASVLETAKKIDFENQTAFNLAVWEKVLADSLLASCLGASRRIVTVRSSCHPHPLRNTEKNSSASAGISLNCCLAAASSPSARKLQPRIEDRRSHDKGNH